MVHQQVVPGPIAEMLADKLPEDEAVTVKVQTTSVSEEQVQRIFDKKVVDHQLQEARQAADDQVSSQAASEPQAVQVVKVARALVPQLHNHS